MQVKIPATVRVGRSASYRQLQLARAEFLATRTHRDAPDAVTPRLGVALLKLDLQGRPTALCRACRTATPGQHEHACQQRHQTQSHRRANALTITTRASKNHPNTTRKPPQICHVLVRRNNSPSRISPAQPTYGKPHQFSNPRPYSATVVVLTPQKRESCRWLRFPDPGGLAPPVNQIDSYQMSLALFRPRRARPAGESDR